MNEVSQDLHRNIYHNTFQPFVGLVQRCSRALIVNPTDNEVSSIATTFCIGAYHLPEVIRDEQPEAAAALRKHPMFRAFGDIANSAKHGRRHDPARQAYIEVSAGFELKEGLFGFVGLIVQAVNPIWGTIDLLDAGGNYLHALKAALDLKMEIPELVREPIKFAKRAEMWKPENAFGMAAVDVSCFIRDASGALVPYDPDKLSIVVYTIGGEEHAHATVRFT